jgi:hypothetical protein
VNGDHEDSHIYIHLVVLVKGWGFIPDASMPRARKNPLTWQNVDLLGTGPW